MQMPYHITNCGSNRRKRDHLKSGELMYETMSPVDSGESVELNEQRSTKTLQDPLSMWMTGPRDEGRSPRSQTKEARESRKALSYQTMVIRMIPTSSNARHVSVTPVT